MPIVITTPANRSARLRALAERHPYMTPLDIAKLTGEPARLVQLALARDDREPPARRIEAKGPLTAAQIADRTGMPLAAAKMMVR